ncbi:MAG TPA: hypothetical protein VFQ61_29175, partial [Polyangiaceae bacterium]|nr:hypothetical protein [Polyangiaceae bacterium]
MRTRVLIWGGLGCLLLSCSQDYAGGEANDRSRAAGASIGTAASGGRGGTRSGVRVGPTHSHSGGAVNRNSSAPNSSDVTGSSESDGRAAGGRSGSDVSEERGTVQSETLESDDIGCGGGGGGGSGGDCGVSEPPVAAAGGGWGWGDGMG